MATSRAAAQTLTELIARTRRELGDPATDPAGNPIPTQTRTFQDVDITAFIGDQLIEMAQKMEMNVEGECLLFTDVTYAENTTLLGMAIPAGIGADAIYKVQKVNAADTTSIPKDVPYKSMSEIEGFGASVQQSGNIGYQYFSLFGDSTGYRFLIRPYQDGTTFRLWYLAGPLLPGTGSDTVLTSDRHREYIALGAAVKGYSINGEAPDQILARYAAKRLEFAVFCSRMRGPRRIKQVAGKWRP